MKNLVVGMVGDQSLHRVWTRRNPDFDLMLAYYGDTPNKWGRDAKYSFVAKGTKFHIFHKLLKENSEIFEQYDAIFLPDDDVHMETPDINRFFELFHEHKLAIAQPSIMGYLSLPITATVPFNVLRYTNWVEIMCPCFSLEALYKCMPTFMENKTNWGIEFLWTKALGNPTDKIAIIDEVVAIHTRPCFYGDAYSNNKTNFEMAAAEHADLLLKHAILGERVVYHSIPASLKGFYDLGSEYKLVPNLEIFKSMLSGMRRTGNFL